MIAMKSQLIPNTVKILADMHVKQRYIPLPTRGHRNQIAEKKDNFIVL